MKNNITYILLAFSLVTSTAAISSIQTYRAHGVVKSIDTTNQKITLSQDSVTELGWPIRDMTYTADGKNILNGIKVGQTVDATITANSPYQASVHFLTPTSH